MAFRFVHTGDWHLAKTFGRFDPETAPLLRDARLRIVDRVGALARDTGADAVLVAGDTFDGPMVGDEVLRRLAARLAQFTDMTWHFLPGNHDPAVANGVWQRFARFVEGAHVVIHHEAGLHHVADDVDILAAPLHARAIAHDPTAWMDERSSAPGTIRIGLAHGAVQGFGSAGEANVLIAPDRAVAAQLDYLALGDWHGVRRVGPRAWYAGTPEPDQFPDNDPGHVLAVRLDGPGGEPEVERHWLAQYRWQRHALEGDLLAALGDLEREISLAGADASDLLVHLDVRGRLSLDDEFALRDRIARLGDRVLHLETDFAGLRVDTHDLDSESFDDQLLAAVAGLLAAAAAEGGDDGAVAHAALLVLASQARDAEEAS